jgi:hypothetical protein
MKRIVDIQKAGSVGWLLVYSDGSCGNILRSDHVGEKPKETKDVQAYMSYLGANKSKLNERYVTKQYEICLGIHAWAEACITHDLKREKLLKKKSK